MVLEWLERLSCKLLCVKCIWRVGKADVKVFVDVGHLRFLVCCLYLFVEEKMCIVYKVDG